MVSVESARKIGINACIDKLGRDFVREHRTSSSSAWGSYEDCVFCFVGVDDNPNYADNTDSLVMDDTRVFPYRASCNVSLEDGSLTFIECVLPSRKEKGDE